MSKMAVIYWSMTGNTQAMAEAIADGAREAGAQADLFSVDQVTVDQALEYDKLALGCPAMGAEVLEEAADAPLRPEDIKRVKGLGFLQHKGTNKFNGRVITRNGRITADEAQAITDAARHYGDGHLMMTTRLTIEVSGIDYGDIDAFRADLAKAGLATGGTGAKVRPGVPCKGTTWQYGLYDTYALGEELHQPFDKG